MVLGKLLVPAGHPTNLYYSRARAYCACKRWGWGCLDFFLLSVISVFFIPLSGRLPNIDWNTVSKGHLAQTNQHRKINSLIILFSAWVVHYPFVFYEVKIILLNPRIFMTKFSKLALLLLLSETRHLLIHNFSRFWFKDVLDFKVAKTSGSSLTENLCDNHDVKCRWFVW